MVRSFWLIEIYLLLQYVLLTCIFTVQAGYGYGYGRMEWIWDEGRSMDELLDVG